VRFPEEQGIGAVPVCRPNAASERNRSLPAVRPIRIAAVSAPQPGSASSWGRCALTSSCSSALSWSMWRLRLRSCATCSRAIRARAGGLLAQRAVDAVEHPRVVERPALQ
jgi:hypothetical protein